MSSHTGIPTRVIDSLGETFASLKEFCALLTEEQWHAPTQLPGWNVKDNLSHIVGTERIHLGLPETEHKASDLSRAHNPIGEMNEHHVDLRRPISGAAVFEEFTDIAAQRMKQLRSADAEYFSQPADTPTGPGTISDFLNIRLLDIWAHEQDMRRALNMPGHQGGPSAEHTIDRLCRTIPMVVAKRAATPEGQTVVIEITGAVQRTIATTITDGKGVMSSAAPASARATITMDSDVFMQLANGRATYAELADDITIAGDIELGTKVVTQFVMMI